MEKAVSNNQQHWLNIIENGGSIAEKRKAIIQLGKTGDVRAITPLRRVWIAGDDELRKLALMSLESIKYRFLLEHKGEIHRTSQSLWDIIQSWVFKRTGNFKYIQQIHRDLAEAGDQRSFAYLELCLVFGNVSVRNQAVRMLARLGSEKAVTPLIDSLSDIRDSVRAAARDSLAGMGEPALEPLTALCRGKILHQPVARRYAIQALGKIGGDRAIDTLVYCLNDKYYYVREYAVNELTRFGDKAVPRLLDALKSQDDALRVEVINCLDAFGNIDVTEPFAQLLKDPAERIRVAVVRVLAQKKEVKMVDQLIEALKDPYDGVRSEAAVAFTHIRVPRAVEPLMAMLDDPSPFARNRAIDALGNCGDPKAADALAARLDPGSTQENIRIAMALANLKDTRAIEPLSDIVNHPVFKTEKALASLNSLKRLVLPRDGQLYCVKCVARAMSFKSPTYNNTNIFFSDSFFYVACRKCESNLFFSEEIRRVILVLDRNMEEDMTVDGENLVVNQLRRDQLTDFDEIRIIDADDYQVERFAMQIKNDTDDKRREWLSYTLVHLNSKLSLSQSKINMLRDHFEVVTLKENHA